MRSAHAERPDGNESVDQAVYDCENVMLAMFGDRRFDSLADMREYVWTLLVQDWFRKRWPQKMRVRIKSGQGYQGWAICWSPDDSGINFELCFPRKKRTEYYVLHEMAHAVTWNKAFRDHGLIFRDAVLVMTRQRKGRAAAEFLRVQFLAAGLDCS